MDESHIEHDIEHSNLNEDQTYCAQAKWTDENININCNICFTLFTDISSDKIIQLKNCLHKFCKDCFYTYIMIVAG